MSSLLRSRKLNSQLENAIQEAMAELDKEAVKEKIQSPLQLKSASPKKEAQKKNFIGRLRSSQK